ncbi:hypothetical protein [Oceanirhabdus sp. W0125-5]|uniref:hypothetical protein n=1 Tax=Oceanirhabdus sp. W0125-5 TaxID=2999116 RepID=UPI0022F323A7|nr:hypothetical protein [Oceanirhabdus sp. W0125-5]WBW95338.1 hypothetical protein OW730_16775 [Oceanirhabdus sp. W0125-5]
MLLVLVFFTIINGLLITMIAITFKMWAYAQTTYSHDNQYTNLSLYLKREIENPQNIDLLVKENSIEIQRNNNKIIFSLTSNALKVKYIDNWGRKLNENILLINIEKIEFIEKGELLYIVLVKDGVEKNWVFLRKKWVDF